MADGYWNRQAPLHPSMPMPKRPRSDFDVPSGAPSGHEMLNYLPRDDDRSAPRILKDTKSIGASYDRYLQSTQVPSFGGGEASNFGGSGLGRSVGGGMSGLTMGESVVMSGSGHMGSDMATNGRNMGFGGPMPADSVARPGRDMPSLPPDASSTLFVEGLPPDSTRREVAHIFRPFLGYKEVRLVNKEPKHHGGDPLILCFVDFANPACAATALSALQGDRYLFEIGSRLLHYGLRAPRIHPCYRMDDHDPDSHYLRLQFARFPGPRSGPRGKR